MADVVPDLVSAIAEAQARRIDEQIMALGGRPCALHVYASGATEVRPIPDDDNEEDEPEGR